MTDLEYMRLALALAERGWGQTAPNPMVGAVVVQNGEVVGEGYHARFGEAHAEPVALHGAGTRARGATLYVTLEPCAHHGKTPPCVDAIVGAGVARVVIAAADPNPQAAGGAKVLRAAGIEVVSGIEEAAARELNAPFFFARQSDRPWVTLKLAVSIDGALTDADRSSAWLTGPDARAVVHRMRAGNDAIGVGVGTVRCDDPLLTVRDGVQPRIPPRRVVFDDRLEMPLGAKLFGAQDPGPAAGRRSPTEADRGIAGGPLIVATRGEAIAAGSRRRALEDAGAEVIVAPSMVDALRQLRSRGIESLLVEGGAGVAGTMLEAAVVDRLVIFQAPLVLGRGAVNAFARAPASVVTDAARLPILERRVLGDDLMTVYALTAI